MSSPHESNPAAVQPASPFAVLNQALARHRPGIRAACAALADSTAKLAELNRRSTAASAPSLP